MQRRLHRACIAGCAAALALACLPAAAINEMFAKDAPIANMTAQDLDAWNAALRDALDRGHDGESFDWKNAGTSASGTIRLLETFERGGLRCRGVALSNTVRGATSRTAWNLCKTPEGWKFAEGR